MPMKRTVTEIAAELVERLEKEQRTRARISEAGMKRLAQRSNLTASFIMRMNYAMDDNGWIFVELETRGGFGMLKISSLDGAPYLTDVQ